MPLAVTLAGAGNLTKEGGKEGEREEKREREKGREKGREEAYIWCPQKYTVYSPWD